MADAGRKNRGHANRTESPRKHRWGKKGTGTFSDRLEYVENLKGVLKSFWEGVVRQSEIQRTQNKLKKKKRENIMNFRKNRKLYKKENVIRVYLAQMTNIYVVITKHLIWNYPNRG